MANINLSKSYKVERLEDFGGIGCSSGNVKTADIINFRITHDGKLKKRSGYRWLFEAPEGLIRDYYVVSDTLAFLLIGGRLYSIDPSTSTFKLLRFFSENITESAFFSYGDSIYLISGTDLYVYSDNDFVPVEGYVPLYGKEWHPTYGGEVNEPFNMLSSRIRISFKMPDPVIKRMNNPYGSTRLEKALINGEVADGSKFGITESGNTIATTEDVQPGDIIEVFLRPTVSAFTKLRALATSNRNASSFGVGAGGAEPSSLALWNGQEKNKILLSRHIDPDEYAHARSICPEIKPIYFSANNSVCISDGTNEITAACRCGQNLAIFTEGSAYLLAESSDGAQKLTSISQGDGCSLKNGAVALDNAPVTVSGKRVLYWSPSHIYDNEYTATCISDQIAHMLPLHTKATHIVFNKSKGEIWLRFENSERTWIYNTVRKCWYTFDGFSPEHMFHFGSYADIAFISNGECYGFSDQLKKDMDSDSINAYFATEPIYFGDINRKKRLARAMILLGESTSLDLTVTGDERKIATATMKDQSNDLRGYCEKRINIGRARYYKISFTHTGGSLSVYSMILSAVK